MNVALAPSARRDLEEIARYVSEDRGVEAANRLTHRLLEACADLANMPQAHPVMARYASRGYRRKVSGRYLIVFRITPNAVEIIRFVHGARDVIRLLG